MSNRVRIVAEFGGRYWQGAELKKCLPDYIPFNVHVPPELKGWKRVKWILENLPSTIRRKYWIIREPRKVSFKRSRYISACRGIGMGRDLRPRKQKKAVRRNPYTPGSADYRRWEQYNNESNTLRGRSPQRPAVAVQGIGGLISSEAPRPDEVVTAYNSLLSQQAAAEQLGQLFNAANPMQTSASLGGFVTRYTYATGGATSGSASSPTVDPNTATIDDIFRDEPSNDEPF